MCQRGREVFWLADSTLRGFWGILLRSLTPILRLLTRWLTVQDNSLLNRIPLVASGLLFAGCRSRSVLGGGLAKLGHRSFLRRARVGATCCDQATTVGLKHEAGPLGAMPFVAVIARAPSDGSFRCEEPPALIR